MIRNWYKKISEVFEMFFSYPISAFAAQATFFLIISAFPFIMLLISLLSFLPLVETDYLQNELCRVMPDLLDNFITRIFDEIAQGRNFTLISVTALIALFTASMGFFSLIRGLNMVYNIKEQRNYFVLRLMAVFCTGGMMLAIILTLILMVFGDKIIELLIQFIPSFANTAIIISSFRAINSFLAPQQETPTEEGKGR